MNKYDGVSEAELKRLKLAAEIDKVRGEIKETVAKRRFLDLQIEAEERAREDADATTHGQRIYDFVGEVSESSAKKAILYLSNWRAKGAEPITIRFFSPGGDVIAGLALYDYMIALRNEGITINTHALGWTASMAGVLLQAGTTRHVGPNAFMLIHEVGTYAAGTVSEIEDEAKFSKRLQDRILAILSSRATISERQIAAKWKRKDWWLDADEMLKLGLADKKLELPL